MTELNNAELLRNKLRNLIRNLGVLEKKEGFCCGITFAQYCAVVEIGRTKEIFLKDLAVLLGLDKSTMSRTVNNLVKQNLVKLETFPENRRYVRISLTDNGDDMFQRIEAGSENYYRNVLDLIPDEKRGQVIESIELLLNAVNKTKCCDCKA